ncbi:MAG: response regulator transcription factor [Chloroflexi bacterium]|nr:response regulator transcription factor [Chloroflexota bacterium]
MNTPIKVLVVEDQAVVRQGLIAILSFHADIEVIGEAENGIEAVKLVKQLDPDVVLLDLVMPEQDGLTTIPEIVKIAPQTKILIVTGFGEADRVYQAIKLGALGYLLKDSTHDQFLKAIYDVSKGEAFIPPSIALRMIREIKEVSTPPETESPLTQRELQTLRFIAQGLSNQDIAKKMVVHERTVAKYVSNILSKLHLVNRTQAALYALREGLIDLDDQ